MNSTELREFRRVQSDWAFIHVINAIYFVALFLHFSYNLTASPYKFTVFDPNETFGTLSSDRATAEFIIDALTPLGLITFGAWLYLASNWRSQGIRILTLTLTIVILAGYLALAIYWSVQFGRCNNEDAPNNICNDVKWCCVYFTDAANECENFPTLTPCTPGITAADLEPDTLFFFKYSFSWIATGVNLILLIMWPVLDRHIRQYETALGLGGVSSTIGSEYTRLSEYPGEKKTAASDTGRVLSRLFSGESYKGD